MTPLHLCFSTLTCTSQHSTLNRWQILAGMQALSIYLLCRLEEGEAGYNNFDWLMMKAVTVREYYSTAASTAPCLVDLDLTWTRSSLSGSPKVILWSAPNCYQVSTMSGETGYSKNREEESVSSTKLSICLCTSSQPQCAIYHQVFY